MEDERGEDYLVTLNVVVQYLRDLMKVHAMRRIVTV
jgi:hypothetical protein